MTYHNTPVYLLNPEHPITVAVIGVGGTGSQVIQSLARMNHALINLGHPGLTVAAYDDDIVSEANVGRQLFSSADIGQYKSLLTITRVNRFYGYDWRSCSEKFSNNNFMAYNIFITCVDSAKARIEIHRLLNKPFEKSEPYEKPYYWLDFGNGQNTGQVILGSFDNALPFVTKEFDLNKVKEKDSGPSCSLAAALNKQDLFINSTLTQFGMTLLWKLFREARIKYRGCYLNLNTMSVNPIKI